MTETRNELHYSLLLQQLTKVVIYIRHNKVLSCTSPAFRTVSMKSPYSRAGVIGYSIGHVLPFGLLDVCLTVEIRDTALRRCVTTSEGVSAAMLNSRRVERRKQQKPAVKPRILASSNEFCGKIECVF